MGREGRKLQVIEIEKPTSSGLKIYGKLARRAEANSLVCFMPAAVSNRVGKECRQLSRFTWHPELQSHHVLALADPAMEIHEDLKGAWYQHPTSDLLSEMANMVKSLLVELEIIPANVLFYGSSLGGYGALALASLVPGASAIAEVPQIDVSRWPIQAVIQNMEELILGTTFDEFRVENEAKIDLRARFAHSNLIPPYLLITNKADASIVIQKQFQDDIAESEVPKLGTQTLAMTDLVTGHKVIGQKIVLDIISQWSLNKSLEDCTVPSAAETFPSKEA